MLVFLVLMLLYWVFYISLNILDLNINRELAAACWILVNLFDVHSTWLFLKNKSGEEGSPIFVFVFDKIGFWPSMVLVKIPMTIFIMYVLPNSSLLAWSMIYTLVVINNYGLSLRIYLNNRN